MSRVMWSPYEQFVLANGEEINFGIATSSDNGWWRFNGAKMGRGYEGEQASRKMMWRNTVRQLEHHNWATPVTVIGKPSPPYARGGFAIGYDTIFGAISTSVATVNDYSGGSSRKLSVNVPPGIWWLYERPSASEDGRQFSYKEYSVPVTTLDEYVADPVGTLINGLPWIEKYLPEDAKTQPWLERLTKSSDRPITEDKYTWYVTAQDVVKLRGGYKSIATKTISAAEELFEALRATGIRISTRTTGYGENRQVESINIYIPERLASVDTINKENTLEVHAEPHTIDISLAGVRVRCGYADNQQKMEEYNKLQAAKEFAGLAKMFDSEPDTTEEVTETYEW